MLFIIAEMTLIERRMKIFMMYKNVYRIFQIVGGKFTFMALNGDSPCDIVKNNRCNFVQFVQKARPYG